jgi:hypothetical protein
MPAPSPDVSHYQVCIEVDVLILGIEPDLITGAVVDLVVEALPVPVS